MTRFTRRATFFVSLLLMTTAAARLQAQPAAGRDSRLPSYVEEVRRASVSWDRRTGPPRQVVDMVCLVPDLPTFLEAIAAWDDEHYYPVLIDDIEFSFKFLRAFQPARIVRFPRKAGPISDDQVWARAQAAVARAWTSDDAAEATPAGDAVPARLGATPPGVVVSAPGSPMLAGAVALAAGRFQPLLRWDSPHRFADVISADQARQHASALEAIVARAVAGFDRLGDDCDFVTLAGDAPYRYTPREERGAPFDVISSFRKRAGGPDAFDDLVGRAADGRSRWAFCGRLLGDPTLSVYRAMCSLFLQPRSALLVNTYDEKDPGWSAYAMHSATSRLEGLLPLTHRSGDRASLAGWHQAFDPVNPFGLVMINTHGEPTRFHVTGGTALTGDVPQSGPAVVLMTHSFSAADPLDPGTIAGRWLANGAYVYYGSMNEPALQAFRTPDLVAALAAQGMPLGAATRQSPPEPFGRPWRLVYLGDPLYRVRPKEQAARIAPTDWPVAASWPRYGHFPRPAADAANTAKLHWIVKEAVARLQRDEARTDPADDLVKDLLELRRTQLEPGLRPFHEALLADLLLHTNRPGALYAQLVQIPPPDRTPEARRLLETCQLLLVQQFAASRDFTRAEALWSELVRSGASPAMLEQVTARVGAMADSPDRRAHWRDVLTAAQRLLKSAPGTAVIEAERKRLETHR